MHDFAEKAVEQFEKDLTLGDLYSLVELDHPQWIQDALARFRMWAGVAGRRDSRRPSIELLDALFGRGKRGLTALFREFEATVAPVEALMVLRALGAICRTAEGRRVIGWNVDNVKPDDGKGRLLVSFDPALDEKLRAAAQSEGQNLSDFVRCAVQDRVETIEKRRPRAAANA